MEVRAGLAMAAAVLVASVAGAVDAGDWQVVTYAGPVADAERAFLVSVAGEPLDAAPPFGYLVRLSPSARAALEERHAVAGVSDVAPAAKASRDLGAATDRVRILLFPDVDVASFAAHLVRDGASSAVPETGAEPVLDLGMGGLALAHLLAHDEVRWVEPLRDRAELDNARASAIVQTGVEGSWSVHARGVDGSTQVVAYCDTGLDTDAPLGVGVGRTVHEQFADALAPLVQNVPSSLHRKVALYYSPVDERGLRGDLDDPDAHGTHVAGTLAGDAGAWGARDGHDGVAFAARLAVCDAADARGFHVLGDYAGYWDPARTVGARVHSNSWGTAPSAEYTLVARQHDAYAWQHRDFLVVRSMGNTGPDGLPRPEAVAKNVLAVGATTNDAAGDVWGSSGRGPALDGRVKPDLVAPGACVTSAWPSAPAAYRCLNGTSQATPVVAGAATLVRDYFAKGFHPSGAAAAGDARNVSAALVRAVLVASSAPVAAGAPDGAEGWGRPELARVLAFDGGATRLVVHDEEAALGSGDVWTAEIDVAEGATLRVVLAWTDFPAPPGASPALVNDLDLEVVSPSGAVLAGNADLGAPDRTNVLERVLVQDAPPGAYTVRVRGWNVPMGPQPFALAAVQGP